MFCVLSICSLHAESEMVNLLRTPSGGIQPQAAVDTNGVVHLIYYKGDSSGGDIFYARQSPGEESFSHTVKVNAQPGSAMAVGTIRGAQLALGKSGRVHVVWNGGKGAAQPTIGGKQITPLLYTRLNDEGTAFEPERNLITWAGGLDGGSSVAADPAGNVYVTWHGHPPGNTNREAGRAVFVARSRDEGKTFLRETRAISKPTGACACCGMRALADSAGAVYILYRAADQDVNRDEILLVSRQPETPFEIANVHKWNLTTCPMSSASLTEGKGGVVAGWETAGQVFYAAINPKTMQVSKPVCPPTGVARKHPLAVANENGDTLLVWTEGTGWARGGAVAWQIFTKEGRPTSEKGRAEGVPVWSLATAVARPGGNFTVIY